MNESVTYVELDSFTKERPRTNFYTGAIYTPTKTLNNEKKIADEFRIQNRGWEIATGPIQVEIITVVNMPQNISKKKKAEMMEGILQPIKKPDLDNIAKLVLDGLQGTAFEDDYQVVKLGIMKKYGPKKILKITIKKL